MLIRRIAGRALLFSAGALVLAACAGGPEEPQPPLVRPAAEVSADELASCNAAHLADAVGKQLVAQGAGAGEVALTSLPEPYRIVYPGAAVTMDFRPDRLTITATREGTITRLTCG